MSHCQGLYALVMMIGLSTAAHAQILNHDLNFPVLNEMRWGISINEVRSLCEVRHVLESSTDSTVIVGMSYFGFPARVEINFDRPLATLSRIQVKFKDPTKAIEDTLVDHFTRACGSAPYRQAKEKSLLIMTIKMEIAAWKSPTEIINLMGAKRNDVLFDLYLSLLPPSKK
jgi:hypothetical protein